MVYRPFFSATTLQLQLAHQTIDAPPPHVRVPQFIPTVILAAPDVPRLFAFLITLHVPLNGKNGLIQY